jgi:hypothetical protein
MTIPRCLIRQRTHHHKFRNRQKTESDRLLRILTPQQSKAYTTDRFLGRSTRLMHPVRRYPFSDWRLRADAVLQSWSAFRLGIADLAAATANDQHRPIRHKI